MIEVSGVPIPFLRSESGGDPMEVVGKLNDLPLIETTEKTLTIGGQQMCFELRGTIGWDSLKVPGVRVARQWEYESDFELYQIEWPPSGG